MKVLIIACSLKAYEFMQKLEKKLKESGTADEITCRVKCSALGRISADESIYDITSRFFYETDAIIFICATGIAVRSIAPLLKHKSTDPAVIVMDEGGRFCIPILSGHYGGANKLALNISRLTGAEPVITTATDTEGRFAVDSFALMNNLMIGDWKKAKEISARILHGEKIYLHSDLSINGNMPGELGLSSIEKADIVITYRNLPGIPDSALRLIPKNVVIGTGCKKDTSAEHIGNCFDKFLEETQIDERSVYAAASIDLKKDEKGLISFCNEKNIPFITYSAQDLKNVEGDFTASSFVEDMTGVDNVCERSAVLHSEGKLIAGKRSYEGVTFAAAMKKGAVSF